MAKDPQSALAVVAEAESSIAGPTETCVACMIAFYIPAAIAIASADPERARRYLGIAEQMAGMFWRTGAWFASIAEARGTIERAEGKAEPARQSLDQAAELFAKAGHRLESERCRKAASMP